MGVNTVSSDPKECRVRALENLRRAETAIYPHARDHFTNRAKVWMRRAADLERSQQPLDGGHDDTDFWEAG
jgi:hypothetical protein